MFDNFNGNLHKNDGLLSFIPRIPIPEYGQSNALLECLANGTRVIKPRVQRVQLRIKFLRKSIASLKVSKTFSREILGGAFESFEIRKTKHAHALKENISVRRTNSAARVTFELRNN